MAKSHLRLVTSNTVKRTVAPGRKPNADLRSREYLTEADRIHIRAGLAVHDSGVRKAYRARW
jgi:hypothetical protein